MFPSASQREVETAYDEAWFENIEIEMTQLQQRAVGLHTQDQGLSMTIKQYKQHQRQQVISQDLSDPNLAEAGQQALETLVKSYEASRARVRTELKQID